MSFQFGPQARAVDVGYGHVKFAEDRDPETNEIVSDSFPSKSPLARDTFVVPVNGRHYEIGKAMHQVISGHYESEVLDHEFATSDAYTARLYGALNYMLPNLPGREIDFLALGLPMNTIGKHSKELAAKFCGTHTINTRGDTVTLHNCRVFPQPLGSYVNYLVSRPPAMQLQHPLALVVDPGFHSVDWLVCHGTLANDNRSAAVLRGVSAVLHAIAEAIVQDTQSDATISSVSRLLDQSLSNNTQFKLYGKPVDLQKYSKAGQQVIDDAARAVKNAIGAGADIEVIILTGGGAALYASALARKFPKHEVVVLPDPVYANVRGFYIMAEQLAHSAKHASRRRDPRMPDPIRVSATPGSAAYPELYEFWRR